MIDLQAYRGSNAERARAASLLGMCPSRLKTVLDIGARDGFYSKIFAQRGLAVTALDLERPLIDEGSITCVSGDVTALAFPDKSFDLVFCAEVLEHIPPNLLHQACREVARVAARYVVIGVPFREDTRLGGARCAACGKMNPPWGHVNTFDKKRLISLFNELRPVSVELVGATSQRTTSLAAWLMDLAGNPYGNYLQEESCIYCNSRLTAPTAERTPLQRAFTRTAVVLDTIQRLVTGTHPNWIHICFERKPEAPCETDSS